MGRKNRSGFRARAGEPPHPGSGLVAKTRRRARISDPSVVPKAPAAESPLAKGWSITRAASLAIGAVAALLLLWIPLGSPRIGAFSDSIEYIILAQQMRGMLTGGDATLFLHTRFPAGFPAWLALAGVDVAHAARANWMSWLAFAWAMMAMALWISREVAGRAAVAVTALTLAVPGLLIIAVNPVSESLFAALLGTALLARGNATSPSAPREIAACIAAALLPLVRTAGLPLAFAFAVWQWVHSPRPRRWSVALRAALIVGPGLAWHGWRATLPIRGGYSSSFDVEQLRERFGSIGDFLAVQALAVPEGLARLLDPVPGALAWILAVLSLALAGCGWWQRWRSQKLDASLLPLAIGMLQIWPWPNEYPRMLWPFLAMLAMCVWQGVEATRASWKPFRRHGAALFAALLAICMTSAWLQILSRIGLPLPAADEPFKRQVAYLLAATPQQAARIASAASAWDLAVRDLPNHVARGDCVYAIAAEAVWLGSGGRVIARHFDQRIDPSAPLPAQLPLCRYVLAAQMTSPQFPRLPALFPLAVADRWADEVFRTEFAAGTQRLTAAALLRQRAWTAPAALRPFEAEER